MLCVHLLKNPPANIICRDCKEGWIRVDKILSKKARLDENSRGLRAASWRVSCFVEQETIIVLRLWIICALVFVSHRNITALCQGSNARRLYSLKTLDLSLPNFNSVSNTGSVQGTCR